MNTRMVVVSRAGLAVRKRFVAATIDRQPCARFPPSVGFSCAAGKHRNELLKVRGGSTAPDMVEWNGSSSWDLRDSSGRGGNTMMQWHRLAGSVVLAVV